MLKKLNLTHPKAAKLATLSASVMKVMHITTYFLLIYLKMMTVLQSVLYHSSADDACSLTTKIEADLKESLDLLRGVLMRINSNAQLKPKIATPKDVPMPEIHPVRGTVEMVQIALCRSAKNDLYYTIFLHRVYGRRKVEVGDWVYVLCHKHFYGFQKQHHYICRL